MSRATKLISHLDRALSRHESFGDNPDAFVDELFADVEKQADALELPLTGEPWDVRLLINKRGGGGAARRPRGPRPRPT